MSLKALTGYAPHGWYYSRPSSHSRSLVPAEDGSWAVLGRSPYFNIDKAWQSPPSPPVPFGCPVSDLSFIIGTPTPAFFLRGRGGALPTQP
ncbi:hypothetical protein MAPG_11491 [Magnaporthiopsis poae ATCC 64411]|uniref:Uncharacterized protein n=1 Tax=Magnaporthiopsis poae (strain ATCC 64411 / 73-15) TaxID=644358 RepID=A0A0C4EFE8_MAGP6|nr:hypothetical protein MAPG_11491 [Magnaporthiopsis poae ATCC 64411]